MAVAGFVALCALPLLAQGASNDTLGALLVEVRLLRQALERSAAAPQVQLLGTRLAVQNARLQTAVQNHEAAVADVQKTARETASFTREMEDATQALTRTPAGDERRERLEGAVERIRRNLEVLAEQNSRARAREAEAASALAEEQNQWLLLNRRLDEIERTLPR